MGRFQREAEVLAALNRPNIAGAYGLEREGSTHAIAMELVEGRVGASSGIGVARILCCRASAITEVPGP